MSVKILNYALDETPLRGGTVILRGVVDPESLKLLKTDDYQREVLPLSSGHSLMKALKNGEPFPDVELGVRGDAMSERNGGVYITDDVFIINGLQRVSAALRYMSLFPGANIPRIGALIHFNTTREWERERFNILGTTAVKISPNILLRNHREESPSMALLYDMCEEDTRFVLHKRVSWKQNMVRADLITAMMLCRVVGSIHNHIIGSRSMAVREMVPILDRMVSIVGAQNVKMNTRVFFEVIDECWGIKMIQYRDTAAQLRGTFLVVLARLMSVHEDFWQLSDKKLVLHSDMRRKLAQFPLSDPTVVNLAASGGKAHHILYEMIKEHLDRGKIKNRLRLRPQETPSFAEA